MTSPGFQALTPIPRSYQGLLIQATDQAVEISQAIEAAKIAGTITDGKTDMTNYPSGMPGWVVQLTIDGALFTGYQFDWLVIDDANNLSLWHGSSAWPGTNPEFEDAFVVPALDWPATITAPVVTPHGDGTATIVFDEPASPYGPFAYTVTQTAGQLSTAAAISYVVADGVVTVTVTGLTVGTVYSFLVAASTAYATVSADSLLTEPIAA